ncbi:nucleotidyltransferase family protein, partial [Cytobacillus oceanisediminis]
YRAKTVNFILAFTHLYQTKQVIDVFNKENIDYVIIKGISLGLDLYENIGMRWFNDVDILLKHDDIKKALSLLKSIGYVQGEYNFIKSSIELANRKDIISSPLLSHEVFPLVKHLPNSNINFHEVDLQFSLDLLTNNRTDELVNDFLIRKITLKEHEEIKTLSPEDHLLFLCIHFYKEAIYLEEVMNHKDFVLYKILDIYRLLLKYEKTLNWNRILLVAEEHNLNRVLLFALTYTLDMYGKSRKSLIPNNVKSALSLEDKDNRELLNLVFDKNGKDKYCWYVPNNQKFFSIKRFEILENIR